MPSPTRRRFLQACVGVAAVGAGCGESEPDDPPTTTGTGHTPVDAEVERLRYDGKPVVYSTDRDESDGTAGEPDSDVGPLLVTSEEKRESLEYRSQPDGWRAVRRFIAETDLSRHALLIVQAGIGECYQRRLVSAQREDDGLDVDFCLQLRPATVACERDAQVTEVLAVRLPFALEDVRGYSVGMGGRCRFRPTEGGQ